MSETLTAREPFAGLAMAERPTMLLEGLSLRCVSDRACISVAARRGRSADLLAAARSAFGIEMPERPRLVSAASISFLWCGRGVWMALAQGESPPDLEARLRAAFGETASLVDQSDSRSSVQVCGAEARALLSRLVPIDLHPRAFRVGDTALTLIGVINGQVTLLDDAPTFELTVTRAFVGSFWESLQEAASGLSHSGSARSS